MPVQAKHGLDTMVMVGDGATDLEARQPGGADLFIGCPLPPLHPSRPLLSPSVCLAAISSP